MKKLFKNATIVNEGDIFFGHVLVVDGKIVEIIKERIVPERLLSIQDQIDVKGNYLLPGIIDDQVHFREPGLTHKGDIYTESRAAAAGGITSFMEMPNTNPQSVTNKILEEKYAIAANSSHVNYSFYLGATNDNIQEVLDVDNKNVCGVKIFMGSSTGNMLVDKDKALENIFRECKSLIALHCEDEVTIRQNIASFRKQYGEVIPFSYHPIIRSREACYKSSSKAVALATKYDTRIHVLHISTKEELELFTKGPVEGKRITSEACVHHMWFNSKMYDRLGSKIKWNPAVKDLSDRDAIIEAVNNDVIDVVATDHAPHTIEEKSHTYFNCPSGGPLVQHALLSMLEHVHEDRMSIEHLVKKMCHDVAKCFQVDKRGYIKESFWADFVVVDRNSKTKVAKDNILYKSGWSPFEGVEFNSKVVGTYVNGQMVYNGTDVLKTDAAMRLQFNR